MSEPDSSDSPESVESGPSGQSVIFRLFVALAIATAVSLLFFAQMVEPGRPRNRVYFALVGDLLLPVIAWFILKGIARHQARKAAQQR